jgi:glycine betaine/proline transport system substrate-binding protein
MKLLCQAIAALALVALAQPALAQITVLDTAQDAVNPSEPASPDDPPPATSSDPSALCGTRPMSIARMSWPSAAILAEIHARILAAEFGCDTRVVQGDLAATASSMGSTGQPQVAPEMWVNRIADLWNGAMEGQQVRSAAPTYVEAQFEGWFMPAALANSFSATPAAADLAMALPQLGTGTPMRFISCPPDWACSVINRNLVTAHGLADIVEIIEPANRLEMDRLIAEALNRRELFLFYYWQPNAILAQLDFVAIDMGAYDEEATRCLADRICADPKPSAFPSDSVVIALAERVFTDMPAIAAYFQRSSLPLREMDALLAQLNAPDATVETVAERFVVERGDIWQAWVGVQP